MGLVFRNQLSNLIKIPVRPAYYLGHRRFFSSKRTIILGIETSCDDTGCAIVDSEGNILGEALHSQHLVHLNNGGIIPPIAQNLHRKHIESVVKQAIENSKLSFDDIDAIATTVKPGLPMSLSIGMKYGKYLCRKYRKPFMPIHHMEAHALTARMHDKSVEFPFLVLLISGGHCLLAVAKQVDKFLLLGESIDDAPGEAFDKMARRMKLRNILEYAELSGGQAIELAASRAKDPCSLTLLHPYSNIKTNQLIRQLISEEERNEVPADSVIPDVNNLCAGFQLVITRHLCHRLQRAMEYICSENLIPHDKQTLIVSGGAACNNFIAKGLKIVCDELGYRMVRPPPHLCTDNGVMIAWNGIERLKESVGLYVNFDDIDVEKSSPLGIRLVEDVINKNISCNWVKLTKLNKPQSTWSD
ncbi:hypothetical protein NQ317_012886 [Molorchus minor]|uniref:N(6)-L-threonylcarbamoyladenine synthase n=1 Tax=Molorchus minor TaxID=1323400 RepID=A0ABQ9JP57_9CUCU|nr:hypothetical protein NQ317_012886 [Molorchus minor]